MTWVGDTAAEIDRLVVATHSRAQTSFADSELAKTLTAHPGIVNGIGGLLVAGPVDVSAVAVIYPYLPVNMRDMLIQNNVDEGIITVDGDDMVITDAGREPARRASDLLDESAAGMWRVPLDDVEDVAAALVARGQELGPPFSPSAFAFTAQLVDRPTQPGRVFRLLSALRYWRADAHRAAWSDAGLNAASAHALNRLWDIDRGEVRVGQGDDRPGRNGVAALEERGWATDGAINDDGRKQRVAIEERTDERTEPIYTALDTAARTGFLGSLQQLPI